MKKFNPNNMSKLDSPERKKLLPTDKVLNIIGVEKNMVIADIGCGTGYFSIPIAKSIGPDSNIYAVDISKEMLLETEKKAKEENISNVVLVQASENSFNLEESSCDMVFSSTVLHEVESPQDFLIQCKKAIKEKGNIIILDWNKVEAEVGPPMKHRVSVDQIEQYAKEVGLHIDSVAYLGNNFYIVKIGL
jgi:ubiquinone/menaquinone biosynthesis C-methylase UbiE